MARDRAQQRERMAAAVTDRLEARAAVTRLFCDQPTAVLEAGEVAAACGLDSGKARGTLTLLKADSVLVRTRNQAGHLAWTRPGQQPAAQARPPSPADGGRPPSSPGDAFYCRHCRRTETAAHGDAPPGWYRLQLSAAGQGHLRSRTWGTLGLYCTAGCLAAWAAAQRQPASR